MIKKPNSRINDLAVIHIAKNDLQMDEDIYRQIIREIGKAKSGSSADLSITGRSLVISYFKTKGWKPRRKASSKNSNKQKGFATDPQIRLIRHLWITLADAGIVKSREEVGLRAWIKSATKHNHPKKIGYSAPEFLPLSAARSVIEQLKKWGLRNGLNL